MVVIFRLAAVRREKVVCAHSDIVTDGLQVARYQLCVMFISVARQEARHQRNSSVVRQVA